MGQLVMSFRGLCMHVTPNPNTEVKHRVVGVNTKDGSPKFGGLPPHSCFLEVTSDVSAALQKAGLSFDPNLGGVPLNGYRLTVANADPSQGLKVDLNVTGVGLPFEVVPHLTDYATIALIPSIQADTGAPSWADCYVDINLGNVTAVAFSAGGIYTTWAVKTVGDPVLQLTGQDGTTVPVTGEQGSSLSTPHGFKLSDGVPGSLVLHNSTKDVIHKEYDFALYYLAGEGGIPDNLHNFPTDPGIVVDVDMTTSCSNSQYP